VGIFADQDMLAGCRDLLRLWLDCLVSRVN
jgi:hypothetical protein